MRLGVTLAAVGCVDLMLRQIAQAQPTAPVPSAPQAQREGRITVARAVNGGTSGSSADAIFVNGSVWGTVIGSDGPCTVHKRRSNVGLSAGTIRITGTVQPIRLEETSAAGGVTYKHTGSVPDPSFADGAAITVEASGGSDLPAFTATVTAPTALAGYTPPTLLSRTGYSATWAAGSGSEILIVIGAVTSRITDGVLVVCRVQDTGAFTVPAGMFELIPASYDRAVVLVARVAETVQTVGDARVMIDVVSSVGSGPFFLRSDRDLGSIPASTVSSTGPGSSDVRSPPAPCETSPRKFLSIGFGLGGVSRVGDVPPTGGVSGRLQLGQRVAHGLHIVEELNWIGSRYTSPFPTDTSEEHLSFGAGIRWTPFEPRPSRSSFPSPFPGPYIDTHAFYLTAVVGADLRDRVTQTPPTQTTDDTAWSPMASLALGLLEIQGQDWSLGPEFRQQLARYDAHIQRGWLFLMAFHLNEW